MSPIIHLLVSFVARKTRLFTSLTMLLIALPSAQAANIYISGDSPFSELHIDGEIVKHDYTRMINVINRHRDIPYMLSLNSKGGNVMESIRIGSFARKYLMRFESKKCNSACLFIMLGSMYRSESKTAEFGIHRPKFKREFFANLTAQEATNKYKSLRNIVEAYMLRMGAKQQLVDDMFAVPSNNMKFIKSKNMATLLNTQSEGYSEWIISKCGDDLNPKQHHDLMAFYKNRSLQGNSYFEYLDSKSTQYFHCELEVVRMEQVRLFNNDARFNVQQLGAN